MTGSEQRWVIGHDTTGKISAFAGTYAVKRYPIENKWIDCYIPDQKYLALTMNRASEAYQTLLHLETAVEYESTYSLLKTLSLQLIRYFGSWLSGQQTKFELSTIISILDALKEEQHISLLSHQLVDLEPLEQIELLHHLSLFGAIGATQDILALLPQSTWKVQEACLQALEQLKTCHNPTEIHGYLFSPRESVRNAALKLISRMGGEAVTKFLIQLHESSQIQISESFIEAVGNTRTFQALTFLIRILLNNKDLLPNVLSALEDLDYVPPSELQRYQDQEIDQIRLLSLCEQLLVLQSHLACEMTSRAHSLFGDVNRH